MLDITSLLYAAIVSFGIFGLDAVWNAGSVRTDFLVAQKFEDAGIKADFAQTVFAREMQEVFATESLIKSPRVRSSHDKTFVTILADSVGLQNATAAFQDLFGIQPVAILATLADDGERPRIKVVGEMSGRGTFWLSLDARTDESLVDLIRRGAIETAIRLDPYHAALYLLDPGDGEPDISFAQRVLDQALAAQPATPLNPARALLHNLRGVVALLENDLANAAVWFERSIADDPLFAPAHLNLAFTRVEQDRYDEATRIATDILRSREMILRPPLVASAHTIAGVSAWAQDSIPEAEKHFAAAVAIEPTVSDAYIYWGRMLTGQGRGREGREKIFMGEMNLAAFENYPEIALLYFWLTDEDDVPLQRRPRGILSMG